CLVALYAGHSIWARESRLISVEVALEHSQGKKCPRCWGEMSADAQFCGLCGKPLPGSEPEAPAWYAFTEQTEKIWYVVLICCVVYAGAITETPCPHCGDKHSVLFGNWRGPRCSARVKHCYSNMRVLLGAIEMYNMDNAVMLDSLQDADGSAGGLLLQRQYLKSPITKPTVKCAYSGTNLTKNGRISCAFHGTVE
ncbi:MAG TPA: zinc ribbon domain-containing protein, partial [Candidatus Ozemobacteraceae bacterium]|nr:zinc ribbon domain-containing protein [Candidatus Ozemobacteraceae bacterium]